MSEPTAAANTYRCPRCQEEKPVTDSCCETQFSPPAEVIRQLRADLAKARQALRQIEELAPVQAVAADAANEAVAVARKALE